MPEGVSVNRLAMGCVEQLLRRREELKLLETKIAGATFIDCGIKCPGSMAAGILFAQACMGGLAEVHLGWQDFDGLRMPSVEVYTDFPREACMASQYAGWFLKTDDYQSIGSGPIRAIIHSEDIFQKLGYQDSGSQAVLCLETAEYPTRAAVELALAKTGLAAEGLYILAAPTASPAGLLQIAARSVETGLHKMAELGYDLHRVVNGIGHAPLPPASKNDFQALGRTNDAILYGATVCYTMDDTDDALAELAEKLPSANSGDYGKLFKELWGQYGNFYDIDPMLFSPARVVLHNGNSGHSFSAGKVRGDLLATSFDMA